MRRLALLAISLVAVTVALVAPGTAPATDCTFQTDAATSITDTGATLNGEFANCGGGTGWRFDYGLTTAYGSNTGTQFADDGAHSASISGLTACTTYHYRIQNGANGALNGGDVTFITGGCSVDTTTTITSHTPNPSLVDQSVSVGVSVVPTSGSGTSTGTVTVSDGVGETCDATLSGGSGSCSLTPVAPGTDTLTAHYNGDSGNNESTSDGVSQTVEDTATVRVWIAERAPTGSVDLRATLYSSGSYDGSSTLEDIAPAGAGPGGSQLEALSWGTDGPFGPAALPRLVIDARTSCSSPASERITLYYGSPAADSILTASGLPSTLHLVGDTLPWSAGRRLSSRIVSTSLAGCNVWRRLGVWHTQPG